MLAILINFNLRGKKFFMLILIMVARATKTIIKGRDFITNKQKLKLRRSRGRTEAKELSGWV